MPASDRTREGSPRSPGPVAARVAVAILTLATLAIAAAALAAPPAHASAPPRPGVAPSDQEAVESEDVKIDVLSSGTIRVTEAIAYQFGSAERHGIIRHIPVRYHYDGRYDRVYRVHDVRVTASPGTPADVKLSDDGADKVMRIGNADRTVTGLHNYTITYDVDGALNSFDDHDELFWNAMGTDSAVPIGHPSVEVATPAPVTAVACFAGPLHSDAPCASAAGKGTTDARFTNGTLGPGDAFTVVVGLPKGAVAVRGPILHERWSVGRAFAVTPATASASGLLLILGLSGVGWLLWRHGRDRRLAAGVMEPFPDAGGSQEAVPLFADRDGPVLYRPPEGLRPAQLGVLIDERADPLDVTATIVDLAVRGYLTIEEIEREHRWSRADWRLVPKKPADDDLLAYERDLLSSLFEHGSEVTLSGLRNTFHADLRRIQGELYDDSVAQGWFAKRPDRVRSRWLVLGIVLSVVGAVAVAVLAATTHWGLVGIPVLVTGLLLAAGHRWMPARTAKGSAVLGQTLGFRRYIEAAEADRMQFAEQENVWAAYLPYAIIFGATKKWARAFADLGADQQAMVGYWYVSPYPFEVGAFSDSVSSFTHTASGTIVSTPGASGGSGFSGGFSGGGGGGGGVGSW